MLLMAVIMDRDRISALSADSGFPPGPLEKVIRLLPSLNAPTVASLYKSDWYSVESIIGTEVVRDLIPKLLKAGAEGIIEYPLNKVL